MVQIQEGILCSCSGGCGRSLRASWKQLKEYCHGKKQGDNYTYLKYCFKKHIGDISMHPHLYINESV